MPKRAIIALKVLIHILCLTPFAWLLHFYTSGALVLNADPVNYITHFTGDWAVYMLLSSLAVTPLRRLSPSIAWLILLALALTSPAFIMRAIGGKNWQRLHRLVYVAATAAVIHFWWLVKTGVRTPWKDTAVLTILLLARLAYTALKRLRKPAQPRTLVTQTTKN